MKTYTVRKELRTPIQCQFYCFVENTLINGIVWDLSATGLRVTVDRPVPHGLEKTIFLVLADEKSCHHIFIDTARVRWTNGREAGWEITKIDELDHTHLTNFLEHYESESLHPGVDSEIQSDLRSQLTE
ncbi:MAG: PilZ domain-containing protein [Nitrospira sp.]